jgi:hypothetical protein
VRLRTLGAAVAVVLAAGTLAGCRTNVGVAARFNGHSISESDVNSYITPASKSVGLQDQSGKTFEFAPRVVALNTLIEVQLLQTILKASPVGAPSAGDLAGATKSVLKGKTAKEFAVAGDRKGFSASFDRLFVRDQALNTLLTTAQQAGKIDLATLLKKVKFAVYVDPRYGKWDPTGYTIYSTNPNVGVPSFVKLQAAP